MDWIQTCLKDYSAQFNMFFQSKMFFFQLSRELAPRDIGYRRMNAISVKVYEKDAASENKAQQKSLPQWIDAKGFSNFDYIQLLPVDC